MGDLEPLPDLMRGLHIDAEGYPIPMFLSGGQDLSWYVQCVHHRICWVCGIPLGRFLAFYGGIGFGLTRESYVPPSHKECAVWMARNWPGLADAITLVWLTNWMHLRRDEAGSPVIDLSDKPTETHWFNGRRSATREEVEARAALDGAPPKLVKRLAKHFPKTQLDGVCATA